MGSGLGRLWRDGMQPARDLSGPALVLAAPFL